MDVSFDTFQTKSFLEIRLHELAYGVPVEFVREINQVGDITPLPNCSPHVCGLMNLRGQVLPVIDLNVRLGQAKTKLTRESCVVVVDGLEGVVGMLVDAVMRVINIPKAAILPAPDTCHLLDRSLVTSIAKDAHRMVTLLDVLHCLDAVPHGASTEPAASAPVVDPALVTQAVKLLG